MTKIRYSTHEKVRNAAHGVAKDIWSTDQLNEVIDRNSLSLHLELGRSTTTPWTNADKEFLSVQSWVLYSSACEVLLSIDEMIEQARAYDRKARDELRKLKKGGSITTVRATYDLTDGLDADFYEQSFS